MRAHSLQICLNFKDPGVQFYGGKIFNQIRDLADDKFNKLPAPKPRRGYTGTRVASMSSYNSRYAGCFDGNGKVTLSDGFSTKLVKDLRKRRRSFDSISWDSKSGVYDTHTNAKFRM